MKRLDFRMAVIGLLLGACAKAPALPEQSTAALSENKVSNNELVSKEKETNKGEITAWVILKERASLAQASAIRDWKVRGTAVHQALVDAADRHQANLRAWLEKKGVSYKSFWIVNTIRVTATQAVLDEIAKRPDVAQIEDDKVFPLPPMLPAAPVVPVLGTEWGINSIRAPEAWSAFNAFGDGIVVANVDTGVQYDHPALVNQYRGKQANGTFNHNYNWYDPSNICGSPSLAPCDNNNHGTHTMGTMVGDDGSPGTNRIGVAPHAKWMAAKGCETNGCSSTALLSAGQWILAPTDLTGANPRPDLRPNVVNNSWGGGGGNTWYQQIVQNWVAAGIFPAFSNGNMGSSCNSSGTPGDYPESFSAGAYDVSNVIASFSSRGPSVFGIIKPNIAAPGVSVRSSIAGGGYDSFSGTSMASPHVAGSVALIWSAAPSLVGDIAATKALLAQTAVDTSDITCGGTAANNNVWGEGKLDVYAAIDQAPRGPTGTLQGTVTSAATSAPLSGVTITISGSTRSATTNSTGQYQLTLPVGTYAVTATLYGYQSGSANPVTITQGTTTTQDFALAAVPSHSISGTVLDDLQAPVANAKVTVVGTPLAPATTATDGSYSFAAVPDGEYDVSVEGSGCLNGQTIHVVLTANTTASFTLTTRKDSFGYACRPATYAFVDATNVLDLTGDDASTSVTLPFSFPFYGQAYTTAYVSTNGFVNLLALDNSFSNTSIPNASTPNAAIYPFWDDLYVDATNGSVLTELVGTAPNRRFVIEWRSVRFFGNSGAPYLRFELALSENGTITFQYATVGSDGRAQGNSATVGVENSLGTAALQYGYNQVMVSDGQAISFVPPSDAPPVNMPPTVNAGNDQTITLPATASLTGAATDDGLPNPPAAITTTWSKVSGPGTVTFGNASALSTTATFSAAGVYTLRLTASDSALSSTDDVVITVNPTSPVNTPPVVNAGPDQAITLPATASLSGTVTDDGLPNPPAAVTTTWSKVSGPGTVTFANASAQATTATFSAAGSYMLRLTASDSALSSSDDIVVTVNPTQPVNTPPVVNAGPDQAITLPASASLSGTVTDDGLPNPPAAVTTTWSKVSGPGTVTFANASARATTATFSAAGSYTLRLTASDSALSSSDDIVVTVNAGPTTPCGGLCNNPTVFTINGSFQSGNLGTGAVCYQTTSNVVGGNCGNLQSPRTLTVNGTTMTCNGGNWSSIPARRNGGYCVQTTAGNYPWAYFTAW